jgi:hypothetical protein
VGRRKTPDHLRPDNELQKTREKGYILKKSIRDKRSAFRKLRGIASVRMSTEEIMVLTRLKRSFGRQSASQVQKGQEEGA